MRFFTDCEGMHGKLGHSAYAASAEGSTHLVHNEALCADVFLQHDYASRLQACSAPREKADCIICGARHQRVTGSCKMDIIFRRSCERYLRLSSMSSLGYSTKATCSGCKGLMTLQLRISPWHMMRVYAHASTQWTAETARWVYCMSHAVTHHL